MHLYFMMWEKREYKKYLKFVKSIFHISRNLFSGGEMTPSKLIQLKNDLKKIIDKDEDFVCIIKLMNDNVFGEEILGNGDIDTGESLIL